MGNVRSEFLKPLEAVFPLPATKDVKAFVEAYEAALGSFSDQTLAAAAQRIIEKRETRSFPLPAECSKACREAIEAAQMTKHRANNNWEMKNAPLEVRYPELSDARRSEADRIFSECEFSREAVQEDWPLTLWEWIREHRRQPDRHEIVKVRSLGMQKAKRFWDMAGKPDEVVEKTTGNSSMKTIIRMREKEHGRLKELVEAS